jgi:hypothetical protein
MTWWASLLARLFPPTQELTMVEWKRQAWGDAINPDRGWPPIPKPLPKPPQVPKPRKL